MQNIWWSWRHLPEHFIPSSNHDLSVSSVPFRNCQPWQLSAPYWPDPCHHFPLAKAWYDDFLTRRMGRLAHYNCNNSIRTQSSLMNLSVGLERRDKFYRSGTQLSTTNTLAMETWTDTEIIRWLDNGIYTNIDDGVRDRHLRKRTQSQNSSLFMICFNSM